jgi:demethylmenaquinone methyltransferase/2-methoxy-6-polyprenyl-1,4-benzoquinol methylase
MDYYWRRRAADIVSNWRPRTIADLATGTGDLALALQKKLPNTQVTGIDFVPEMLDLARRKGVGQVVLADAMNLPFAVGSFDCLTIAFGLRNFENWAAGLAEMSRVLKPNAHLLVLEFSLPRTPVLRSIYRLYLHHCLPFVGSVLTRERSAYAYLGESIEQFPSGDRMCQLITQNGFRNAVFEQLTGGIVTIYTAAKS